MSIVSAQDRVPAAKFESRAKVCGASADQGRTALADPPTLVHDIAVYWRQAKLRASTVHFATLHAIPNGCDHFEVLY